MLGKTLKKLPKIVYNISYMILRADNYLCLFTGDGLSRRQTASEHSCFTYFIFDFCYAFIFYFKKLIYYFSFYTFCFDVNFFLIFLFNFVFLKILSFQFAFFCFFNLQFYSVLFWGLFTLHCDFLTFVIYIPNEECRKTHSSREAGQEGSLLVYFYPYFWLRSPNPTKFLWRRAASKSLTPGCHGFLNEFCFEFQYL